MDSLCYCKHFKQNTKNNPTRAVQVESQALTGLTTGKHYLTVSHSLNSLMLLILSLVHIVYMKVVFSVVSSSLL